MQKNIMALAFGVIGLVGFAPAFSAIVVPYGWYLEGNVGQSSASDKSFAGTAETTGYGFSINGGYKFSQFVAGEIGYTNYADTRVYTNAGTLAGKDARFSYDIAGKLILPVGATGTELFGKLGIGRIHTRTSASNSAAAASMNMDTGLHTANGMYMAAGADYAFSPNVLANMQWARQKGSNFTGTADLYTLGLAYIF